MWIGGLPVVLLGVVTDVPAKVGGWFGGGVIALNGVVSLAIGMTVWNHILRTLRSYEASVLGATSVIFTALFAMPILGERLGWSQVGAIGLMFVGISLAQVRGARA